MQTQQKWTNMSPAATIEKKKQNSKQGGKSAPMLWIGLVCEYEDAMKYLLMSRHKLEDFKEAMDLEMLSDTWQHLAVQMLRVGLGLT